MATVCTIGHSNRDAVAFLDLLRSQGIECVVDVRRFPGSRRLPQFGREALEAALHTAGIGYLWMEGLGGRRSSKELGTAIDDSSVAGWENSSFRAYAAYMQTQGFADALNELVTVASAQRTAIMCSEAKWWQCHRRMISDALLAQGHEVRHIMSEAPAKPHALTEFARVEQARVTYPSLLFDV